MWATIKNAFKDKDIRKKIFLTLGMLLVYRIGGYIPIPGLDSAAVQSAIGSDQGFLNIMSIITGGALSQGTLFSLGILPFINAFIIMQLLTLIIPKLERLSKEGDEGRRKVTQITRYVALGLAVVQGIGIMITWNRAGAIRATFGSTIVTMIFVIIVLTAGSAMVMWLGERITEYGIGNGTSLIIFIGIISTFGTGLLQSFQAIGNDVNNLWYLFGVIMVVILLFVLVVFVDLSERKIMVRYAKQVKGNKMYGGQTQYIPIKVNSTGVMPIIFASSFLMFPQLIGSFWPEGGFYRWYNTYMGAGTWLYSVLLCVLIIFFAYFYAQIQFNPIDVARNIQQYGGFIPGIRPGKPTSEYLAKINNRITLFGALFLAFVALIPSIAFMYLGQDIGLTNAFSATGILIVVSVAMELNKQLESQIMMRNYKGFLK